MVRRRRGGLTGAAWNRNVAAMTTTLTNDGRIVIPRKLRQEKKLRAGDELEFLADEDDANIIVLRRVEKAAQPNWVDVLLACPAKGWFRRMPRRKESMRKVRL